MTHLEDWSAWTGTWPFGLARTLSMRDLLAAMDRHGIARAYVSPLAAVLAEDPMVANAALAEAIPQGDRVRLTPVVNPTLHGWERDFDGIRQRRDVTAVRLLPTWHGWGPESPCAGDLLDRLAGMGCTPVVQLRMMDERSLPPFIRLPAVDAAAISSWVAASPEVTTAVCGAYAAELPAFAEATNAWLDLSFVESRDSRSTAREVLPNGRIVFGSLMPLLDAAVVLKKHGDLR
jgi:uncharacterized protein